MRHESVRGAGPPQFRAVLTSRDAIPRGWGTALHAGLPGLHRIPPGGSGLGHSSAVVSDTLRISQSWDGLHMTPAGAGRGRDATVAVVLRGSPVRRGCAPPLPTPAPHSLLKRRARTYTQAYQPTYPFSLSAPLPPPAAAGLVLPVLGIPPLGIQWPSDATAAIRTDAHNHHQQNGQMRLLVGSKDTRPSNQVSQNPRNPKESADRLGKIQNPSKSTFRRTRPDLAAETGGGGGVGMLFSSAVGGAYWPDAIRCPSLGPFPSIRHGAHRHLTTQCPSSCSLPNLSLSTALSFPLGGCQRSPRTCPVSLLWVESTQRRANGGGGRGGGGAVVGATSRMAPRNSRPGGPWGVDAPQRGGGGVAGPYRMASTPSAHMASGV